MRTEQQIAADQILEDAIRTVAEAYGFGDEAVYVGDWFVVAEHPQIATGRPIYGSYTSGEHLPEHRARGLIQVAAEHIDLIYAVADEEDD